MVAVWARRYWLWICKMPAFLVNRGSAGIALKESITGLKQSDGWSEDDTEAESCVVLTFDVAGQCGRTVGGIAVVAGQVESPVLLLRGIDFQADFGRGIEAPCLVVEATCAEVGSVAGKHGPSLALT